MAKQTRHPRNGKVLWQCALCGQSLDDDVEVQYAHFEDNHSKEDSKQ